jgi:hypothetical protein
MRRAEFECQRCECHVATVRLSLQPKFASPEQQWLCADCACDALQDWLFGGHWVDVQMVSAVAL